MLSIIIAISVVVYIFTAAGVGIHIYDKRPSKECKAPFHFKGCPYYEQHKNGTGPDSFEANCSCCRDDLHSRKCQCHPYAIIGGTFWPFIVPVLIMGAVMSRSNRRKRITSSEIRRAEHELNM